MKSLLDWLPYIGIAVIPGIVNLIAAWQKLTKKCQFLPFFKPQKSLGFWVWAAVQLIFPVLLFWLVSPIKTQPNIELKLIFEALGLGIGFVAFLNASTEVGTLSLDIKPVYDFFIGIAYELIANNETRRTASFWDDVGRELNSKTADLKIGLKYLEDYFLCDVSLSSSVKQEKQDQLKQVQNKRPKEEKVKAVKSLIMMNVRRKDLSDVLKKFQCSSELLNRYFSN